MGGFGRRGEAGAHCVGPFLIAGEIALQQIREKEEAEHEEKDEQFDEDYEPELPPYGHGAETVNIKHQYAFGQCRTHWHGERRNWFSGVR